MFIGIVSIPPLARHLRAGQLALSALVVAIAALLAFSAAAQERFVALSTDGLKQVILAPGTTLAIETDVSFTNVVVGDPEVADLIALSSSSFYLQGIKSGTTNLAFYNGQNKLIGVIDVRIRLNFANLRREIRDAVPGASVSVSNINNRIRIAGTVEDRVMMGTIMSIAEKYTQDPIINDMLVSSSQQVMLQARILEVSRTSGRELGVNLTRGSSKTGVTPGDTPFGSFVGTLLTISGTDVDFVINALEAKSLARRLANPSIATLSGTQGNFVVGGEVPITRTSIGDNGTVSSETSYREYGVRLNFVPTVLDNGLIRLRIEPEVSEVDESPPESAGGVAFISRKAATTVLLRDGQSFAIAGLLQANNQRSIDQLPWLGNLPVIGALFRSTAFQKNETDLVIVVTPTLVRPGAPNEPLRSPLDTTRSSDDVELFLLGLLEVDKDMIRAFRDGDGIIGPYGHIIDLEFDDALISKK
jgi:pilus assembly protein CpaC